MDLSDPHLARQNRLMPNLLALWRLCERPACRRARSCRGIARQCVDRHAAAVPEPVREGVEILLRGRRRGIPYAAIRQAAPKPLAAIDSWLSLATGPLRRRAHAPAERGNAIFTFR